MKEFTLLTWLTQLGLTVIFPLLGFLALALWLHNSQGWGSWVIWVGIVLGIISAFDGFRTCLKLLSQLSADKSREDPTIVSFNDHD